MRATQYILCTRSAESRYKNEEYTILDFVHSKSEKKNILRYIKILNLNNRQKSIMLIV